VPADWPIVEAGTLGKLVIFDPTSSTCPLGVMPGQDQSGWGLIIDSQQGQLIHLPQAKGAVHTDDSTAVVTLLPEGQIRVSYDDERRGLVAAEDYATEHFVRADQKTDSFARGLHDTVPFVHDLTWHEDWKTHPATYHLHLDFTGDDYARQLGTDLWAIAPRIGAGLKAFPEWKTTLEGVSWLWTGTIRCHVTLKLPDGVTVEELPEDWNRTGATVSSHLTYRTVGNEVHYESELLIQPGFYDRQHYEAIRKFLVKFQEAEKRPVLLRKVDPAAKT